ncbi:UNVERIFIED_CONTAM: hypothetical protein Sangu_0368400 [Sesamum angustifolium]|uniref:Uncharacterized protein n=1 Tax=Sesamum angustifolium TaxID=2727405 RepID=A0AAW2QS76_9LAMI
MSMSAFLHTILAKRRPIPLIEVKANMIFCFPSTLVFCTRRMCWKSSFATTDCKIHIVPPIRRHKSSLKTVIKPIKPQPEVEHTIARVPNRAAESAGILRQAAASLSLGKSWSSKP